MIHTRVPWKWLDLVNKLEIPDDLGPLLICACELVES